MGRGKENIDSGMTVILFTTHAPDTLADELCRQRHEVYEAIAISEVLALAEEHPASGIVITPDLIASDQRPRAR